MDYRRFLRPVVPFIFCSSWKTFKAKRAVSRNVFRKRTTSKVITSYRGMYAARRRRQSQKHKKPRRVHQPYRAFLALPQSPRGTRFFPHAPRGATGLPNIFAPTPPEGLSACVKNHPENYFSRKNAASKAHCYDRKLRKQGLNKEGERPFNGRSPGRQALPRGRPG